MSSIAEPNISGPTVGESGVGLSGVRVPQLRGKRFAVGFALFLSVATTWAVFQWVRTEWPDEPPMYALALGDGPGTGDGQVLDVHPSPREEFEVEMVMRRLDSSAGGAKQLWWQGVYRLQVDPTTVADAFGALVGPSQWPQLGVTVADGVLTLRAMDTWGHFETHAFSLHNGKFEWRRRVPASLEVCPSEGNSGKKVQSFLWGEFVAELYRVRAVEPAGGPCATRAWVYRRADGEPAGDSILQGFTKDERIGGQVAGGELHLTGMESGHRVGLGLESGQVVLRP